MARLWNMYIVVNIKDVICDLIMNTPLPTPRECVGSLANHFKILFWVNCLSPFIPIAFYFARNWCVLNILKLCLYLYWSLHAHVCTFFCCENVRILSNFSNSILEKWGKDEHKLVTKFSMQLIPFYRQDPHLTSTNRYPKI